MRAYKQQLNAGLLAAAVLFMVYATFTQAPERAWSDARVMLAATGASLTAAVPVNPYNTLATQLQQEQQQLDARQAALNAEQTASSGIDWGFYSLCVSAALFVL